MGATGQFPDDPSVDGAEKQVAGLGARANAWHIIQYPRNLCTREIRIQQQTGAFVDFFVMASSTKLVADFGRATILPDDGIMDGITGLAIPDDGGFALVGDAETGDVAGTNAGASERLDRHRNLREPDFLRVLLHPARLGINLTDFFLGHGANLPFLVENNGPHAGG